MKRYLLFKILVLSLISTVAAKFSKPLAPGTTIRALKDEEIDKQEFKAFCKLGFIIREKPDELENTEECAVEEANEFDVRDDLPMLFTLMVICAWGGFVRALTHHFHISIPYTIILLVSGLIVGGLSHVKIFCNTLHKYTAIARISPQHILYTFLPILIFESAYAIPVHIFVKSSLQILLVAFPGMVICTFGTALTCWQFFAAYQWDFLVACLFGCIVSATDPVAVVSILRTLGVSEQLSVLIDGESLMNDGVAILLFEIFHEFIAHPTEGEGVGKIMLDVAISFCRIAIGGPIFGWVTGRVVIFLLGYVYNDPAVEISATICAAYLTYWTAEYLLKVSGVMALVLLGLTLSAERTVISPVSVEPVHHFWEMLGYLANTVLFVLVGIVISETAIPNLGREDFPYLFLLYVTLHVMRLSMLILFYPILKRLGYGLSWESMMIMMWGGLRGAVGVCLALQVYQDVHLCDKSNIGPKILFHTAGIVFLTLVINGTTTKGLLQTLKLTEVTAGQKEQMNTAVRRISHTQWKLTRDYQSYKYMLDASWDVVNSVCTVTNPYIVETEDAKKIAGLTTLNPPRPVKDNTTVCWHCNNIVQNEPTIQEYREMTNDARIGVIKAMKVHYSHQFEEGVLTESAVQVLLTDAEYAEDIYLCTIQSHNFHKYMKVHGFYPWLRDKVIVRFGLHKEESLPEPPSCKWRYTFYWLVTRDWFDPIGMTIVLLNVGLAIAELTYSYHSDNPEDECLWTQSELRYKLVFYWTNVAFTMFYTIEASIRLLGLRFKDYICSWWNYLDLFVLAIACGDLYLGYIAIDDVLCKKSKLLQSGFRNYFNLLRFARILRAIRLLKPIMPHLLRKIKRETHVQVFTGYDIGRGFVKASDDVIKFIPQICENKKVQQVIKHGMQREVNSCIKDLALIQNKFPGVAVALQTRHACRSVLNRMIFALNDVQDGGLLDDGEVKLLQHLIEEKMRRLTHSPHYIIPTNPLTTHNDAFNDEEDKGDKKASEDIGIPPKIATNP